MRILVFGAGGFVGGWICEELSQRDDLEEVACVHKWASAARIARRGVAVRQFDLEEVDKLPAILTGADVVINAATLPSSREPELVRALYVACVKAGVRRFIQFSSAAIYGNRAGDIDEKLAPAPVDDYSRGKAEMESRLLEAASKASSQLFILRPSIIYGPFSDAWTVRYVERIVKRRWRGLGRGGDGCCNLVHAHDVAHAVIAAATADIAPGVHVLNINGPDVVSWNEYIERLGDALGTPDRITPNVALLGGIAVAVGVMRTAKCSLVRSYYQRSTGATRAAMKQVLAITRLYPSLGELNLLRRKARYLADQAAQVLGVSPSIRLEEGLRQSVAWCRVHGVA